MARTVLFANLCEQTTQPGNNVADIGVMAFANVARQFGERAGGPLRLPRVDVRGVLAQLLKDGFGRNAGGSGKRR